MRIAAISDMHGNAVAFDAVIDDLHHQSPDVIVCLGDIVMRGPEPQECVDMLRSLDPLVTVQGNFDHRFTRWPKPGWRPQTYKDEHTLRAFEYDCRHLDPADQDWLGNLPTEHAVSFGDVAMELYHAAPGSLTHQTWPWATVDELSLLRSKDRTNLVMFGHMHHAFVRQALGFTVVNSGSIGLSFDGDNRAGYAVIDIEKHVVSAQIRRVAYDVELSIRRARTRAMPDLDVYEYALRQARYPYHAPLSTIHTQTGD